MSEWPGNPQSTRILIVDDDAMLRTLLKSTLRTLEHTNVEEAPDAERALHTCKTLHPDIVFLDINLPGDKDGLSALQEIGSIDARIFTVMVTAHGTVDNLKRAMSFGVDAFVVKPFTGKKILNTLHKFYEMRELTPKSNTPT